MKNEQAINIKPGQKIRIYDGCSQCDKIEEVVRVEKSEACYDTVYIYSVRDNALGYDERLSTPSDIKELYEEKAPEIPLF
jgi:hypothetical protein